MIRFAAVILGVIALSGAFGAQMLRWLRVLQREHYEPESMYLFLGRWSTPQVSLVSRSKVRVVRGAHSTLANEPMRAMSSYQDCSPAKLGRTINEGPAPRRPITLSHLLLFALFVTVVVREDVLVVITSILYGQSSP